MDQDQNTGGAPVQVSPLQVASSTSAKSPLMLIGGIIATLLIVAIGWYAMQDSTDVDDEHMPAVTHDMPDGSTMPMDAASMPAPDAATAALSAQGTSDDIADIDADLNATDLTSLDSSGI